jgi:DNA primase catalytic core
MPLLIDPEDIDKVKRSADLAAIVRAHGVELKKSGKQLVGKCPFHSPDKTPSFFVDPAGRKWKCFGACVAGGDDVSGGDVISFLMKIDKLTFPEAFAKAGGTIETKELPPPRTKKTNGNGHETSDLAILARVVDFYHRSLLSTRTALEYAASRGIANADLLKAYRIGYADGSLVAKATGSLRAALRRLGVIGENDHELLRGCLIFPLLDENGAVVSLYGRAIDRDQHLYLPGTRRGLFNSETVRGAEEVIIAESIIDAMSAIEAGVMNVLPMYGAGAFTPDHDSLLQTIKPKRIALALDNDETGRSATAKLAQQMAPDFDVRVIELPRKDLNEVLVHDGPHALKELLVRIDSPTSPEMPAAAEEKTSSVAIDGGEMTFTAADRTYLVRGVESKRGASLRVGLKLSVGEKRVIDNVDLYSARSRNGFLSRVAEAELGNRIEVERDLLILLDAIELHQKQRDEPPPPPKLEMSQEERDDAMRLLLHRDFLDIAAQDMELLGYVGEDVIKKLGYVVALSRMLDAPLSMVIMSQSGSGKSALADVLEKLTPPEAMYVFSRLSAQSLYWMERDALQHKFIVIEERAGSADADYSIRALQSKKKLILAVPIKDPGTGRIQTKIFEVLGPAAFLETTTERYIHPENATRCFEMWCDESIEQTQRIHQAQRRRKTLDGRRLTKLREAAIRRHQNAQRLLRKIDVVIPFADLIDFPCAWLRTRRDNERFLNLIEAITFQYQFQREKKIDDDGGEYIEATIDDYARAYALAKDVLGQTLADVKKPAAELYEAVRGLAARGKGDGSLTRREIREATGLPDHRVNALLSELVQLEYLEIVSGANGKTFRYRLSHGPAPAHGAIPGLTTPEELRAMIEAKSPNLLNGSKRFSKGSQPVETKERKRG